LKTNVGHVLNAIVFVRQLNMATIKFGQSMDIQRWVLFLKSTAGSSLKSTASHMCVGIQMYEMMVMLRALFFTTYNVKCHMYAFECRCGLLNMNSFTACQHPGVIVAPNQICSSCVENNVCMRSIVSVRPSLESNNLIMLSKSKSGNVLFWSTRLLGHIPKPQLSCCLLVIRLNTRMRSHY